MMTAPASRPFCWLCHRSLRESDNDDENESDDESDDKGDERNPKKNILSLDKRGK